MYKNVNPSSLGVSGRQSELIELTLTYGFRGLDLEANELIKRATLQGVDEAAKYLRSGKVNPGGWKLPVRIGGKDEQFQEDLDRLGSLAETAKKRGLYVLHCGHPASQRQLALSRELRASSGTAGQSRERDGTAWDPVGNRASGRPASSRRPCPPVHSPGRRTADVAPLHGLRVHRAGPGYLELVGRRRRQRPVGRTGRSPLRDAGHRRRSRGCRYREDYGPGSCDADRGEFPEHSRLVRALAERGYDGPITVQPHSKYLSNFTRDQSVEACARALDEIMAAAGLTKSGRLAGTAAEA